MNTKLWVLPEEADSVGSLLDALGIPCTIAFFATHAEFAFLNVRDTERAYELLNGTL